MTPKTYLFIHQNMPAQFLHMCRYLRDRGDNVVFITRNKVNNLAQITKVQYDLSREPKPEMHPYLQTSESAVLHAQAVYRSIAKLKQNNIHPDIVIGHAGWGETMMVRDVLPDTPILNYFEFFYRSEGQDLGFDPEYPATLDTLISTRFKNIVNHIAFDGGDWGLSPTQWQMQTYPAAFQNKMSVIHEGIDTQALRPNPQATFELPDGRVLRAGQKIISFVARNLEPYRGFHTFMRAIPEIQRRHPDADIVIVGKEENGYGKKLAEGDSYKTRLLAEVTFNPDKVHFTGHLVTDRFRQVLQISAAHIYLTYPFVLSWSMMEAMSSGCLLIGSRTTPVEEVITHKQNGFLVDFFNVAELADTVCQVLARPEQYAPLRTAARSTILAKYDLASVTLPKQIALLDTLIRTRAKRA
jgi:glycosyltransferase involved in cell wall biosynthesis